MVSSIGKKEKTEKKMMQEGESKRSYKRCPNCECITEVYIKMSRENYWRISHGYEPHEPTTIG